MTAVIHPWKKREVTLRDLRRLISDYGTIVVKSYPYTEVLKGDNNVVVVRIGGFDGEVELEYDSSIDASRIDRLISAHGPRATVVVVRKSNIKSPDRGGSGSGSPDYSLKGEERGTDPSSGRSPAPDAQGPEGQSGPEEGTAGMGSPSPSEKAAGADNPGRDARDAARAPERVGGEEKPACSRSPGEAASPRGTGGGECGDRTESGSTSSPTTGDRRSETGGPSQDGERAVWGGVHCRLEDITSSEIQEIRRRSAREVIRALDRLLRVFEAGATGDPSPRIHPRRLVRELVSRRVSLSRSRREECERAVTLLLVDVSGSCSAAARGTVCAAQAVHLADPERTVVMIHSNGLFIHGGLLVGGKHVRADEFCPTEEATWAVLQHALRGRRLAGTVAWGDWDASWLYRELVLRAPLVWLDSYRARVYGRPVNATAEVDWHARGFSVRPLVYFHGVNDAVDSAIALRETVRNRR